MKLTNVALALATVLSAGWAHAGTVTVKGSDTMVLLGQRWAEEYMKKHGDTSIQVTGGGSGTGISALINGTTDICQSSRAMKPAETQKLRAKYKTPGLEIPVAKDGLAIYVHASNPLNEITMQQLKAIFTGKMQNWKDAGGPNKRIIAYSRENSSGTYVFFKERVLDRADFGTRVQSLPGTASVVNAVSKEKFGIGYGGDAFAKGIKILRIKNDATSPSVRPDKVTVKDGTYVLARPLFFYLRNAPTGESKAFIEWALSPEGQALASQVGYYPIK